MPEKCHIDKSKSQGRDVCSDQLIVQSIVDLYVARRILLIYPATHDQVEKSLSKTFDSLSAVLSVFQTLTLAVLKDGLCVDGRFLNANPIAFTNFAKILRNYQIAALTFLQGMERLEIIDFLRLITLPREEISAKGGIAAVAAKNKLSHLEIHVFDYSQLQVSEEGEIQRTNRRGNADSIYQQFISQLLANPDGSECIGSEGVTGGFDPTQVADMINRGLLDSKMAVEHYTNAIDADCDLMSAAEDLNAFQAMIRALNPELQDQFLASTFDRCVRQDRNTDNTQLIDGLGAELIMRMLVQANTAGKPISPSLVAFMNKIGHLNPSEEGVPNSAQSILPQNHDQFSSQSLESLLAHEQYSTYVDAEYEDLLKNINELDLEKPIDDISLTLTKMVQAELAGDQITSHVGRAMMRLMVSSTDATAYRDWARQLAYLVDDLLEKGAFDFLSGVMDFAQSEKASNDSQRSKIAGLLANRFNDPQFVQKAIETVRKTPDGLTEEAKRFLTRIGELVVIEILDNLDPASPMMDDAVCTQLLKSLSEYTVREALDRLKDPRSAYVVRMLELIRRMGDSESAQQARTLLQHEDFHIRMAALSTLLQFRNKWGLIRLRELLVQPLSTDYLPAMELAGEYGVREMVPLLIEIFEQRGEVEHREAALRALGHIGDPAAVPSLTKLAQRKWCFSKVKIDYLKRVLFETLEGYPFRAIKPLLHYGLRIKDNAIQSTCFRILQHWHQAEASFAKAENRG